MAGRSDKLNAEASEVPADCAENTRVRLAGVATAGTHLTQAQRTAKEPAQFVVQGGRETDLFLSRFAQHKVFAPAHSHSVVPGFRNGPRRTDFHARGAKDATAEIEGHGFSSLSGDGL